MQSTLYPVVTVRALKITSRVLVCAALASTPVTGCGSSVDPEPEKKDGSESQRFEPEDIEAAENAHRLVEIYCDGGVSEAQITGCLSHVTEDDVCADDTAGKQEALAQYRDETGDDGVCD